METTRRAFLGTVVGGAIGGPVFLRRAWAQNPIKIGLPAALSGSNAQYGIQAKRACELFAATAIVSVASIAVVLGLQHLDRRLGRWR